MENCILCEKDTKVWDKKCYNGKICKDCMKYIPSCIRLSRTDTDYLKPIYKRNKEKAKIFNATASYGSLFIDSVHNMFCVSRGKKNDEPTEYGDLFYIKELKEVGLYCSDVKNIGTHGANKVVCNVKMKVVTDYLSTEYLIISNENCSYKVSGTKLEWNEPEKLSVFRAMYNQMIDNVCFDALKKLEIIRKAQSELSKSSKSKEWAKGIFFLNDKQEYTVEELKERRNELIRIFHPDLNTAFADNEITVSINEAYKILTQ